MVNISNQLKSSLKITRTTPSLLYCQANNREKRERLPKGTQGDGTIPTVRLGLDKIETKKHGIDRFSTYTTISRLYRTKIVSIKEKTSIALRV